MNQRTPLALALAAVLCAPVLFAAEPVAPPVRVSETRDAFTLDNGLLHIDLFREVPEPRIRSIPIQGGTRPHNPAQTITVAADAEHSVKSRAGTGQKREV